MIGSSVYLSASGSALSHSQSPSQVSTELFSGKCILLFTRKNSGVKMNTLQKISLAAAGAAVVVGWKDSTSTNAAFHHGSW
jgi:hypothetical protein